MLSFILISIPVLIQCYLVHKRFVFYDDSGPLTLLTGNVSDFTGSEWVFTTSKIEKFKTEYKITYFNILKFIIKETIDSPIDYLKLYGRKIYFLFSAYEFPSNLNYYMFQNFSILLRTPWSIFSIFTSFGLTGILLGLKEFRRLKLLYIFFAGISLSILLVYVPGRFRLPLVPLIMLFAAYSVSYQITKLRERNYKIFLPLLTLSIFLFFIFSQEIKTGKIRDIDYGHLGAAYYKKGEMEKALLYYKQAIKINPLSEEGYIHTASLLYIEGMTEQAMDILKIGVRRLPSSSSLIIRLGEIYFDTGDIQNSERIFREALARDPNNIKARNNLAIVLMNLNRKNEAISEFRRVLEANPDFEEAKEKLEYLLREVNNN